MTGPDPDDVGRYGVAESESDVCDGLDDEQAGAWIFTFGNAHRHPETQISLGGRYVRITGTERGARARMVALFGIKWAFQYDAGRGDPDPAGVLRHGLVELRPEDFPTSPGPPVLAWRGVRLERRWSPSGGQLWRSPDDRWRVANYHYGAGDWHARLQLAGCRVEERGTSAIDALENVRRAAGALRRALSRCLP